MQKHSTNELEVVEVLLPKEEYPLVYDAIYNGMLRHGSTKEQAEEFASRPLRMEVFYSPDNGVYMVDSGATEIGDIYDPYTGDQLDEPEDSDIYNFKNTKHEEE